MRSDRLEHTIGIVSKRYWFSILRLTINILLIGSAFVFLKPTSFSYTLLTIYAASGLIYYIYVFVAKEINEEYLSGILIIHIVCELIIEGLLVNHVGGNFSPFILFFIITIISSAPYFYLFGAITIATIAGLLYASPIFFDLSFIYDGLIESSKLAGMGISSDEAFYTVFLHLCIFYFFAFISGYLAQNMVVASRELSNIKLELNEILEQLRSGLISVDKDGNIVYFNKAGGKILGIEPGTVKGKSIYDVFPARLNEFKHQISQGLTSGILGRRVEIEVEYQEDIKIPIGLSFSIIKDDKKNLRGLITLFQDLTEIKKLSKQLRTNDRLAAVGQLAAGIAHEIRNPLASISGSVEVLKSELQLNGDNERLLELILKESSRLNTIIGDFLSFARVNKNINSQCDLISTVNDVLELSRSHELISDNVSIEFEFHQPGVIVAGGEDQIKQIVWNLIINSAQAFDNDGGEIRISASKYVSNHSGEMIRLIIADNGPGIPADLLTRILDPFFSTKKEGTGLGLPIVARIVNCIGGQFDIDNSSDAGTSVSVYLPCQHVEKSQVDIFDEVVTV